MTWEIVPLGEIAKVDANTVPPERIADECTYVGLESIGRHGAIDESITAGMSNLRSAKNSFDVRHVLFGKLRPNLGKVARPSRAGVSSTDIYPLLPNDRVDRNYLAHFLLTPESIAYASSRVSGVNLPRVSWSSLAERGVPLPPLPEQRRIAAILDEADALRGRQLAVRDHIDEALQRFLEREFRARPVRSFALGQLLARIDSGHSPVCEGRPAKAGEWGVLKLGAVTGGQYLSDENKAVGADYSPRAVLEVKPGDILLSRKNTLEHVGASVYVSETPERRLLPDLIFRPVPRDPSLAVALQAFLALPTTRRALSNMAGGSANSMANISKERLRTLPVPRLDRQLVTAVDAAVSAAHDATRPASASLNIQQELFASLQHRAFRGEL